MTWRTLLPPLAIAALLQTSLTFAQPGMGMGMGMGPGADLPRFVNAPQVGEQIPDLTIVDDQGNPVNIRELVSRSPYTVLTLGCLT